MKIISSGSDERQSKEKDVGVNPLPLSIFHISEIDLIA